MQEERAGRAFRAKSLRMTEPGLPLQRKLLASFKAWIDVTHFYGHEQSVPDEIAQPPLPLAIYLVRTGAAHLRWLAELNAKCASAEAAATK